MSYSEFEPQPTLASAIKCFWTLEEEAITYNSESIMPDSYVELIVNCGAPLFYISENSQPLELPRVFLKGLQNRPMPVQVTGLAQLIGVRVYPWMIPMLFDQQAENGEMPFMPLTGIWAKRLSALAQALQHSDAEVIATLQQIFSDQPTRSHIDTRAMHTAGTLMYATQGQMRIHDLAAECSLSVSQFERQFKQRTGLSPKAFTRLVRFEAIRDSLVVAPSTPLTEIAHTFGYADQAHFIHDFKAFAHRTPSAFALAASHQNADFLQLPSL